MFKLLEGVEERQKLQFELQQRSSTKDLGSDQYQQLRMDLISQKKAEKSRQAKELQLLQICKQQKISCESELTQFCQRTANVMFGYGYKHPPEHKSAQQAVKKTLLDLFVGFFQHYDCKAQAQLIDRIYRKNICSIDFLVPTLVSWFSDWSRKKFMEFLDEQIKQINIEAPPKPIRKQNVSVNKEVPRVILSLKSQSASKTIQTMSQEISRFPTKRKSLEKPLLKQQTKKTQIEPPSLQVSKDIYYGLLNHNLLKIYRTYNDILDLDQLFLKRFKKLKYNSCYDENLTEFAVENLQSYVKPSIVEYSTYYQKNKKKKSPRKNMRSMYQNIRSICQSREPIVQSQRYAEQDQNKVYQNSKTTSFQNSSLLMQLPMVTSPQNSKMKMNKHTMEDRTDYSKSLHEECQKRFLINIYSRTGQRIKGNPKKFMQLSKTIEYLDHPHELDLLNPLKNITSKQIQLGLNTSACYLPSIYK